MRETANKRATVEHAQKQGEGTNPSSVEGVESTAPIQEPIEHDVRVGVLVPTYNHGGTLLDVLRGAKRYLDDVIVVDDGSTDQTATLLEAHAEEIGVEVIRLSSNQGKGGALMAGFKRAHELGWDVAITIDSDGQHDPDDIPTFLDKIRQEPDALIVGSRHFGKNQNITWKSRFGRGFSNFWLRVIAGRPLPDSQSGFRAYPVPHILALQCRTGRYEFEVEVLVRSAWAGIPLRAVPIDVYYPPKEERISHFRTIRDFLRISLLNSFLFFRLLSPLPKKKVKLRFAPQQELTFHQKMLAFWRGEVESAKQSNAELAVAVGFGAFMGIVPIWGYQMLVAAYLAHIFKMNKIVVLAASNISFGPMPIPITMASLWIGHFLLTGQTTGAWLGDFSTWSSIWAFASAKVVPWLLGSMLLAVLVGLLLGLSSYILMQFIRKTSTEDAGGRA